MIGLDIALPLSYRLRLDNKRQRAILMRIGGEVAAVARRMVRRSVGGGRVYWGTGLRAGRHQASLPGQPPAGWSGALANSIKSRPFKSGEGVVIRDAQFYALFLEMGAKGGIGSGRKGVKGKRNAVSKRGGVKTITPVGNRVLEPRPFLSAALDERKDSIGARVKDAILQDIKFVRVSPSAKV